MKKNIYIKIILCILGFWLLLILNYFFTPIKFYTTDLDKHFDLSYTLDENQKDNTYIFTLGGLKVNQSERSYTPQLFYSGKTTNIRTGIINDKKIILIPANWKDYSLSKLKIAIENNGIRDNISTTSISIDNIRNTYQKIDMDKVVLYKLDNINRIIYDSLDSYKIVTYSYRPEVSEPEIYWNKNDSYYYIISPDFADTLFYAHTDEQSAYSEYETLTQQLNSETEENTIDNKKAEE